MRFRSSTSFMEWCRARQLRYDEQTTSLEFEKEDFILRIPIEDFHLQLDYRINAAISLLPVDGTLLLARKTLSWDFPERDKRPLDAVLHAIFNATTESVVELEVAERPLAFAAAYLTNRWGRASESLYMIPEHLPEIMLRLPGSYESVFVITRTLESHDQAVRLLSQLSVPAYGPHVADPPPLPRYENFRAAGTEIEVNPRTGKLIGPGCPESYLLSEFLPPEQRKH